MQRETLEHRVKQLEALQIRFRTGKHRTQKSDAKRQQSAAPLGLWPLFKPGSAGAVGVTPLEIERARYVDQVADPCELEHPDEIFPKAFVLRQPQSARCLAQSPSPNESVKRGMGK